MKKFLIGILMSSCFVQAAFAGGLTTTFGEVLVENLPLGKTYSMEKEAKAPLIITNTSSQEVNLRIDILTPRQEELKDDFEAIPDVSWIGLEQREFVIEPEQSARTDVTISIPEDGKYLGKKFQVYLWSHTVGSSIGVGLKSRLLFTVSSE